MEQVDAVPADAAPADTMNEKEHEPRTLELYRRLIAGFTLFLIAVSWKLWTPQTVFPQIPFFEFATDGPALIDYIALIVIFVGAFISLFATKEKLILLSQCLLLVGFAIAFLLDQHRLQPWAWQFFLATIFYLCVPKKNLLSILSGLAISIYFFSAISKFDLNFIEGAGQYLLAGTLQSFGLEASQFSETIRHSITWLFPVGELLVAILLFIPKTRFIGLIASLFLHVSLLMTLGPLGLNHSWGVLGWNLFFITQNLMLFWETKKQNESEPVKSTFNLRTGLACLILLLPTLEWFGYWDHWPGWTVYSERSEKVRVIIRNNRIDELPDSIRKYVSQPTLDPEWSPINMDRWSIDSLGVPQYPQLRVELACALALRDRFDLKEDLQIQVQPVASRWTSKRSLHQKFDPNQNQNWVVYDEAKQNEFFEKTLWNHKSRKLWLDR